MDCDVNDTLFMPANAVKAPLCPYHRMINLDASGTYRVTADCESPSSMQHKSWFVLTPAMEFYFKQKSADYKSLPPFNCELIITFVVAIAVHEFAFVTTTE